MDDAPTTRLLVWDEADVRTALASVLVWEAQRPPEINLTAVYLWLADRCEDGEGAEANLFTLVEPGTEAAVAAHITAVRTSGFGVVARPARSGSRSLTPALTTFLDRAAAGGDLVEVFVASHDGDGLHATLEKLSDGGVPVTVVGFRERAGFAADSPHLGFLDLEEVDGAFSEPLARTNLFDLPDDGLALPPLRLPSGSRSRPAPPRPPRLSGLTAPSRPSPVTVGIGRAPAEDAVEPPPSGPSTAGALDDLLAGVQAAPLDADVQPPSPPPPPPPPAASRPGRVSPPNGEVEQG